jgi:hypothetical protein
MINYYKDHNPCCSDLLTPLTTVTKKRYPIQVASNAFLQKQTVLEYPDFTIPFEIYIDASNKQIGSVIQQNDCPLASYSHKDTDAQTHYTIIKLELLAIVETLQEYRIILLGHIVKIYTDHKNLGGDHVWLVVQSKKGMYAGQYAHTCMVDLWDGDSQPHKKVMSRTWSSVCDLCHSDSVGSLLLLPCVESVPV